MRKFIAMTNREYIEQKEKIYGSNFRPPCARDYGLENRLISDNHICDYNRSDLRKIGTCYMCLDKPAKYKGKYILKEVR